MPPYFVPNFQISFFIPLFLPLFHSKYHRIQNYFPPPFHFSNLFLTSPLPSPFFNPLFVSSTIRTEDVRFIFFFLLKWTRNTLNFAKFSKSILSISIFFSSLSVFLPTRYSSPRLLLFARLHPSPLLFRAAINWPSPSPPFLFPSPRRDLISALITESL